MSSVNENKSVKKPIIVFTGFGPFGPHAKNPSWDAVSELRENWNNPEVGR